MDEEEYGNENQESLSGQDVGEEEEIEETEEEVEQEEAEPPVAAEAVEPAIEAERPTYRPFVPSANPHINELAASLEEQGLDPNLAYTMMRAVAFDSNQRDAANTHAGSLQERSRAAAPEFYNRDLSAYRANLQPALRGTAVGEIVVALGPELEKLQETGDIDAFWKSLEKRSIVRPSSQTSQPVQRQPQRALTPEERIPSPTGGATPPRRQEPKRTRGATGVLAKLVNMDEEEVATYVPYLRKNR